MHRPHLRPTCAARLALPPHPSTARADTPSLACASPAPPATRDNAPLLPRPSTARADTPRAWRARHAPSLACVARTVPCLRTARTPDNTRQRAPRLLATPQPIRRRAHSSLQSATHGTLAPLRLAATSSIPSFALRAPSLFPSPPPTGASAGAPRRMRGFMRK